MRKKTIKAKIASLLSASMAFTMLAPAMPANAANPKLIFDFKTQNKSVLNIVSDWEFSGPKGNMFKAAIPAGWTSNSSNIIGLPYWNSSEVAGSVDGFEPLINTNSKAWDAEDDTISNGMGLKGYIITEWKSAQGDSVNRVDQPYFQENPEIYYATLGNNGSNVASYWVKREGKDGKYIPLEDKGATPFKAGAPIFVDPETPVGYKLLNISRDNDGNDDGHGNHGKTIEIFKSQTPTPATNEPLPSGTNYNKADDVAIEMDSLTKKISGNAHNRDMVIHYKYDVDETQKFNVNVWDVFFDGNGNEISRTKRTTISRNVLGDLKGTMVTTTDTSTSPATVSSLTNGEVFDPAAADNIVHVNATTTVTKTAANVGFDSRMIDPVGGLPARYIKKGASDVTYFYQGENPTFNTAVTVVFSKGKNNTTGALDGDFKPKNMVDANRNTTSSAPTTENKTFNIDSDFSLHGKMINQKVDVYYNYQVNPAYYRNVSVQYIDENGTNITGKVIAAVDESSYIGPAISNTYDSTQPTKLYKNNNELILKVDSILNTSHVSIPIPKLKGYKFNSSSDISIEPTEMTKWNANYSPAIPSITMGPGNAYATAEIWQTSTANESVIIRVMYNMDPAQLVKINPEPEMGGDIKVADSAGNLHSYDTASYVEHQKYVDRQEGSTPGMTKVTVRAEDLPDPVPNVGYLFDKWVYDDGGAGIGFMPSDLPKNFEIPTGALGSALSMKFKAVFKKDPMRYNSYHLESGDSYTSFIGDQNPEILNANNSGNPIDIYFTDLAQYTDVGLGIVLNSHPFGNNYNLVWYDSSNNIVLKLDNAGNILEQSSRAILSGETFKVFVESDIVPTTYTPIL